MLFPVTVYGCESWIWKKHNRKENQHVSTLVLEKTLGQPGKLANWSHTKIQLESQDNKISGLQL